MSPVFVLLIESFQTPNIKDHDFVLK